MARYPMRVWIASGLGPLADGLIFIAALGGGTGSALAHVGLAHIVSFACGGLLNYLLTVRTAVASEGRTYESRLYGHFLVVNLAALFLRGGVLSLVMGWGCPAQWAIWPAVAATVVFTRAGHSLCLTSGVWSLGSGVRWRALAIGLVVCSVLLRLIYCSQIELLPEETYYWNYSRHLDIGYLDHPPMVAWLIRAGTTLLGDSELGVRAGALLCGLLSSVFIYRLTRNLFDEAAALVALVLMQGLPFFFFSGILMTPDAPLTAAWAALLYFLERALIAGRASAWWGAGLSLGLGMLSKYTIVMVVPAAFIFMVWDAQARRWLWHWLPYTALALAAVIFAPVIYWNATHEWASFAFQTARRLAERPRFSLHRLLLSVLVLLTPAGAVSLVGTLWGKSGGAEQGAGAGRGVSAELDVGAGQGFGAEQGAGVGRGVSAELDAGVGQAFGAKRGVGQGVRVRRFMQLAVLVPLAVFFVFSLRHEVKLDWTGTLWLAAMPAIAWALVSAHAAVGGRLRAWAIAAWPPTLVLLILIYGAAFHYLVLGLPGVGYSEHIELVPVGWRSLGDQVAAIDADVRRRTGVEPLIVGMDRYAIASQLAFYSPDRSDSVARTSSDHLFGGMGLMYARWFPVQSQVGRTLLLVGFKPEDLEGKGIEARAARWGPLQEGVLARDGRTIRRYYYRLAYDYQGAAADR